MLHVTPEATRHLLDVRRQRGVDDRAGARFIRRGTRIGLTFAPAPQAKDHVIEGSEINVFVAAEIAETLDQSVIDARTENGQVGLVLRKKSGKSGAPSKADSSSPAKARAADAAATKRRAR
jgi:Fe-S cluster assembly iron-binding protein IscA